MELTMAKDAVCLKIDEDRVAHLVEEAVRKLDAEGGEVILDFSSVRRIDPSALKALEGLANLMNGNASTVALSGVNVEVYKVLKLTQLASRFSFLS